MTATVLPPVLEIDPHLVPLYDLMFGVIVLHLPVATAFALSVLSTTVFIAFANSNFVSMFLLSLQVRREGARENPRQPVARVPRDPGRPGEEEAGAEGGQVEVDSLEYEDRDMFMHESGTIRGGTGRRTYTVQCTQPR